MSKDIKNKIIKTTEEMISEIHDSSINENIKKKIIGKLLKFINIFDDNFNILAQNELETIYKMLTDDIYLLSIKIEHFDENVLEEKFIKTLNEIEDFINKTIYIFSNKDNNLYNFLNKRIKLVEHKVSRLKNHNTDEEAEKKLDLKLSQFSKETQEFIASSSSLIQKQFNEISSESNAKIQHTLKETTEIKEKTKELYDTLIAEKAELFVKISDIEKQSREKYNEILKLNHLSSSTALGAGYLTTADSEMEASKTWRFASVVALGITILWLFDVYGDYNVALSTAHTNLAYNWVKIGLQASISFLLLYTSIYASQLATRYRNESIKNRSLALQMAALEPYISKMDDEHKSEMRKAVGARFFTGTEPCVASKEEKQLVQACTDAIPKVVEEIKGIIKK